MAITAAKAAGAVAITLGAGALLAACAGGRPKREGPMAELSGDLMARLKPGNHARLSVTADAVRQVTGDGGRAVGAYDGARLLRAADAHAYGAPAIIDPRADVRDDGFATFNEIRQVVRSFDADASGVFDQAENRAFEAAVGIRWIPA